VLSVRQLPRTVVALGVVSLLTDLASEMIYPLLPGFLAASLGAGVFALGTIEGVAESTAALVKLGSGIWSDRLLRRKPLILAGYGLASAARPLIGFASSWIAVLAVRFADRIGKGLRSSPRDALIGDVTPVALRGAAFGLHRAMDHAGAVAGPLVAAGLLELAGWPLRDVFFAAAIPGAVVILVLALGVTEPARPPPPVRTSDRAGLRELGGDFRRLLAAVVVFTLGNSTDAFLLLRLGTAGIDPSQIALMWSAQNAIKVGATWLGGRLSDRLGRRSMVAAGWLVYAAVYLGFALVEDPAGLIAVFFVYALYFGLTEPVERAWIADLAPAALRGSAYGWYHGAVGLAALPASLLFAALWFAFGAPTAFAAGAALAAIALALLLRIPARAPTADRA
jgi:MFS family permease